MVATKIHAALSRYPLRPGVRFAVAAACTALLVASSATAQAAVLNVGNVYTFSTGSTPAGTDPAGTWTLGDKSFTYLNSSGFSLTGPGGLEQITLANSLSNVHSFLLANLATFGAGTYTLGYRLDVVPASPFVLDNVELDSNHLSNNTLVTKDVYSTSTLYNNGTGGAGDLANLQSTNGSITTPASLLGLTQVWVRDTIVLDGSGQLAGITNNYQQVPEIDASSLAGAFPLLVGGLALLARSRRRTPTDDAASAGS
jgi:hypothetical protein